MDAIERAIARISGRCGKSCYRVLHWAVLSARDQFPGELSMCRVYQDTARRCGKSERAVCKALSRATKDAWEYGSRAEMQQLLGHELYEKPSPKDLITALCQFTGPSVPQVAYAVYWSESSTQYGIWGRAAETGAYFVAAPSFEAREAAEQFAERLNQEQMPIERCVTLFLSGKAPAPLH